jgi:multicomponent Na+:H+ antiporter subunit C
MDGWIGQAVYMPFVVLAVLGTYLMLSHRNFVKAVVGLQIFQTAIILFFILLAVRADATIPIQPQAHDGHGHYQGDAAMHNPLPHALMLTAIVVGVATQGVALAILRRIRRETGTVEDQSTEAELS